MIFFSILRLPTRAYFYDEERNVSVSLRLIFLFSLSHQRLFFSFLRSSRFSNCYIEWNDQYYWIIDDYYLYYYYYYTRLEKLYRVKWRWISVRNRRVIKTPFHVNYPFHVRCMLALHANHSLTRRCVRLFFFFIAIQKGKLDRTVLVNRPLARLNCDRMFVRDSSQGLVFFSWRKLKPLLRRLFVSFFSINYNISKH